MRSYFVVALVFALGLGARGTPASGIPTAQDVPPIQGALGCVQDFPSPHPPGRDGVMCGLDNPRGLAFSGPALYVAEAGRGGRGLSPSRPQVFRGPGGRQPLFWRERSDQPAVEPRAGAGCDRVSIARRRFRTECDRSERHRHSQRPGPAVRARTTGRGARIARQVAPTSRSACSSLQPFVS